MARKGWDSLSPGYRMRMEKAGLTRADYESGQSIKKARGHEKTPERPRQYSATKFPLYDQERARLEKELEKKKKDLWGDNRKWNPTRSEKHIREKPAPLRLIRWALQASEQELIDAIREDYETYSFLGYG